MRNVTIIDRSPVLFKAWFVVTALFYSLACPTYANDSKEIVEKDYTFLKCNSLKTEKGDRVFPSGEETIRISTRMELVLNQLSSAYSSAFPGRPPMELCISIEEWNGASGSWTVSRSLENGPLFFVRISDKLPPTELEVTLAHEIFHPIVRLLTGIGAESIPPVVRMFGDELMSTAAHPFVFHMLSAAGYIEEEKLQYKRAARNELERLKRRDFKPGAYNFAPQQTWSALWYFNFFQLAPVEYQAIKKFHRKHFPPMVEKMEIIEREFAKLKKYVRAGNYEEFTAQFLKQIHRRLNLDGRVRLKEKKEWEAFLFGN